MKILTKSKQKQLIDKVVTLIEKNERNEPRVSIFSGLLDLSSEIGMDLEDYDRIKQILGGTEWTN